MDLLGRKVPAQGGAAVMALAEEIRNTIERARGTSLPLEWSESLSRALQTTGTVVSVLLSRGAAGKREEMLLHSADFFELFSTVVVAWQWLLQAVAAEIGKKADPSSRDFYEGKLAAAAYWMETELPRVKQLASLCQLESAAYAAVKADWF